MEGKDTVVLNIWSNHVFTYDKTVNKILFNANKFAHLDKELVSLDEAEESMISARCSLSRGGI